MSKKKILVVDDMIQLTKALVFSLKAEGYDAIMATSGEEGLEKTKQEKPDLIILDIMMPGMDGLEVCQKLKEDEELKSIPIILFTAKNQKSDVVEGMKVGADDYVVKPYKFEVLHGKIQKLIGPGVKEDEPKEEKEAQEGKESEKEPVQAKASEEKGDAEEYY